jgi:hypothetical protein
VGGGASDGARQAALAALEEEEGGHEDDGVGRDAASVRVAEAVRLDERDEPIKRVRAN